MTLTVEAQPGVAVVHASGELDAYCAPDLERVVGELRGHERVVLDLERVSFLDSTALGLLVRCVREVDDRQGAVRVALPLGTARRIFEITTLDRVLPVSSSYSAALAEVAEGRDG
jgi:anti-sigma B factor antagonist